MAKKIFPPRKTRKQEARNFITNELAGEPLLRNFQKEEKGNIKIGPESDLTLLLNQLIPQEGSSN